MKTTVTCCGLALLGVLGMFLGSCNLNTAKAPLPNNPFDPNNPETHGDPFKVQAELNGRAVRVTWREVEMPATTGYRIYRNENSGDFTNIADVLVSTLEYTDATVRSGQGYGYYITARFGARESNPAYTTRAYVSTAPALLIENGNPETSTRNVMLTTIAFGAQWMLLANTSDFAGGVWEPYSTTKPWQLTTGAGTKQVFMRVVYTSGDTSGVVVDEIEPAELRASLEIAGGATATPTRRVPVRIGAVGAIEMQVYNVVLTGNEPWTTYADSLQWELTTGAGTKTLFIKVRNDFLIEGEANAQIVPAPINPSIEIAVGAEETPSRRVPLRMNALGAIEMQVSNSPLTDNQEWATYADSVQWDLTPGVETKTVFIKVRNDFLIESEASDQIEPATIDATLIIQSDSIYTNHTNVSVSTPSTGALEMRLSNTSDSVQAGWQPYQPQRDWVLLDSDGWRLVHGWFRNDFFICEPVSDSIGLDRSVVIRSFDWSAPARDTLIPGDRVSFTLQVENDAIGVESDGIAFATVEGWPRIQLRHEGNGEYLGYKDITISTEDVFGAIVSASFTDRAGNNAPLCTAGRRLTSNWLTEGEERTFALGSTTIKMSWIPPGSFMMGCVPGESDAITNQESPRHLVTFTYGFWMAKYELTQFQWQSVMGVIPENDNGAGDEYPVYNISWSDVQVFEQKLDNEFRLPSEAEWEYACRANTTTRFYWGDDPGCNRAHDYAWFGSNRETMMRVGQKGSNQWGLYDMSGNAMEWCEDRMHSDYNEAPTDGSAWLTGYEGSRSTRSRSFTDNPEDCRSARRGGCNPDAHFNYVGFRLVRSAD